MTLQEPSGQYRAPIVVHLELAIAPINRHSPSDAVQNCIAKGLLINCTHDKVLRVMPPLGVTKQEIDRAVRILDEVFYK